MNHRIEVSRRTVLRGLGAAIALPLLESWPRLGLAAQAKLAAPARMAFVFVPNGVHMPDWKPTGEGTQFALPPTLQPLEPVKKDLLVLTGLTHDKARPNGDGPGDHARSAGAFLTASQPRKTHGADIKVGISVDQFVAQRIGDQTPLPSLELGIDRGANAGNCDSGYSCAYSANISWRDESTPAGKEVNPRSAFERLFGGGDDQARGRAKRIAQRKSILDFVREEAQSLKSNLSGTDQRKLDEYLTSIREIEQRITAAEKTSAAELPDPQFQKPEGIPSDMAQHLRLMYDLLALAFQADVTRIATFMVANEGSNRNYPWLGVPEGHHDLSHHGRNAEKQAKIAKINRFHIEQFAYFVQKLQSIREGEGTLLDHSMIVYGSAIGDGDRHNHDDLPVLLVGSGGGAFRTGRHVIYPRNTPMANLFLNMMDVLHVQAEKFGDSTGRLEGLSG
jgi:hypothetical protein